ARHAHALEDARRRRRRADRAGLADVVRSVRLRPAMELVPPDRPGEALPVRDAAHLHLLAGLERLDGDVLADDELALPPQLEQVPVGAVDRVRLEVPGLRLRDLAIGDLVVGNLHRVVAVRLGRLQLHDWTRLGLDHRHRRDDACLRIEDAGHPQLPADDPFHSLISMSTPAGRSRRMSASTVLGVGEWMSIRRLCVRTSKCSRESLSLNGDRITQYTFFSVGSGTGPVMVAPVRWAVSTID